MRKATLMMVNSGAALMSRSGGNDEKGKLVMEAGGKNGKEGSDRKFFGMGR
jgi:hypothetical protein